MHLRLVCVFCVFCATGFVPVAYAQRAGVKMVPVDSGWAANSVNTVVFRKNSLVSCRDTQFIAFYNPQRLVVLGKRKLGTDKWLLQTTAYQGNTDDAHNCISIMADGKGYLHLAWDHHNNQLHYAKSVAPFSLQMTAVMPMTGLHENRVSYPEFYRVANGNLLFFYRDGGSGQGNLVMNTYDVNTGTWTQLQSNLVDGQGQRNAYWQACTDVKGTIHLSWVWRESPDVASNHDLCYACSKDGGFSWQKSTGEKYHLPVTEASAEHACTIPQRSELINQTSMVADVSGHAYIATYWRDSGQTIPQYHIVYQTGKGWQVSNLLFRKTAFSLSGGGTKRIPIARPQIIAWQSGKNLAAALIFRDEERGNKVSVAVNRNIQSSSWKISDLTAGTVGQWEPTYDTELWKGSNLLHLFVQQVQQADAEGKTATPPQMIQVLEYDVKGGK